MLTYYIIIVNYLKNFIWFFYKFGIISELPFILNPSVFLASSRGVKENYKGF